MPLSVASLQLLKLVIRSRLLSILQHHGPVLFLPVEKSGRDPYFISNYSILPYEDSVKYLGITFDRKLTFGLHINEVVCNVKLRLNILKVVSGFNLGADRICLLRI